MPNARLALALGVVVAWFVANAIVVRAAYRLLTQPEPPDDPAPDTADTPQATRAAWRR